MLQAVLLITHAIAVAVASDRWRTQVAFRRPMLVEISVLKERIACLREQNELLRARLQRVPPRKLPRFRPHERLAVLAHAARYALSVEATARAFVVTVTTVLNWRRAVRKKGQQLLQTTPPANKLPDLIADIARRLKREWPRWGTRRIAGTLARLGLKASRTTVQAFLRRPSRPAKPSRPSRASKGHLAAKHPGHLWFIDFTRIGGLFRSFVVGAVIDGSSRKVLAVRLAPQEPTAAFAVGLVREATRIAGKPPAWIVNDHGTQFTADEYRRAVRRKGTRLRYGAIHRTGSLAIIERFWKSMKEEYVVGLVLYRSLAGVERSVRGFANWFNTARPHQGLDQRTPDEVYFGKSTRATSVPLRAALVVARVAGDHDLPVLTLRNAA